MHLDFNVHFIFIIKSIKKWPGCPNYYIHYKKMCLFVYLFFLWLIPTLMYASSNLYCCTKQKSRVAIVKFVVYTHTHVAKRCGIFPKIYFMNKFENARAAISMPRKIKVHSTLYLTINHKVIPAQYTRVSLFALFNREYRLLYIEISRMMCCEWNRFFFAIYL